MEAGVGIEPTHKSFAGSCITTLLPSHFWNFSKGARNLRIEKKITRFEAAFSLKITKNHNNNFHQKMFGDFTN